MMVSVDQTTGPQHPVQHPYGDEVVEQLNIFYSRFNRTKVGQVSFQARHIHERVLSMGELWVEYLLEYFTTPQAFVSKRPLLSGRLGCYGRK